MSTRSERRGSRRLRSRRIRALLAGGLVFGLGAAVTIAAWSDQENATTTITAGTFSIVSRAGTTGSFTSAGTGTNTITFTTDLTGIYPGVKRAQVVQVQPGGTLGGVLNMSGVTITNAGGTTPTLPADLALRSALRVDVTVVSDPATCLASLPMPTGLITAVPSVPQQTLTVGPASTTSYCFVIGLPLDADGAAQGGSLKPTWTFTGQTN